MTNTRPPRRMPAFPDQLSALRADEAVAFVRVPRWKRLRRRLDGHSWTAGSEANPLLRGIFFRALAR